MSSYPCTAWQKINKRDDGFVWKNKVSSSRKLGGGLRELSWRLSCSSYPPKLHLCCATALDERRAPYQVNHCGNHMVMKVSTCQREKE